MQRVDSYLPPASSAQGLQAGAITGRIFAFDGVGKPSCSVTFEASSSSDAGVDVAERELKLSLRNAFRAKLAEVPQ